MYLFKWEWVRAWRCGSWGSLDTRNATEQQSTWPDFDSIRLRGVRRGCGWWDHMRCLLCACRNLWQCMVVILPLNPGINPLHQLRPLSTFWDSWRPNGGRTGKSLGKDHRWGFELLLHFGPVLRRWKKCNPAIPTYHPTWSPSCLECRRISEISLIIYELPPQYRNPRSVSGSGSESGQRQCIKDVASRRSQSIIL